MTDGRPVGDRNAISSESPAPATTAANRVRTVFLGSGRFAQPILGRLAAHPSVDVVGVVTAPPRPTGRRQLKTPTPVETTARELGIAVMTPERLRDTAAIADILGLEPTLLVLADYGQIVPDELLEAPDGALNLHPSLLPRHRGATPIPAAILEGDEETGVSLMRMDSGLDTGPLIAIERVSLAGDETTPALEARLAIVAAGLLARSLDGWLAGTLPALPQAARGTTMTRPLRREDGRLDPSDPAWLLERRIRAYLPWPGSFLEAGRDRLVVLVGSVAESEPDDVPGTIVPDARGLALATSEGRLILDEVQPAGARPMSGEAFLRGRPSILGASVRPPGPEPRADATASGATAAAVDDRDPPGEPA